jgi:prepilin-type N-terminal cleavage/methylation domain-containing protein
MHIHVLQEEYGFTLIEIIISLAIFAFLMTVVVSFLFWMNFANTRSKADREVQENARRLMDEIMYEVKSAKGVYTSTTSSSQLSLETTHYLPTDETTTYIDFFLCGSDLKSLCLKKESQNPVFLNSDSIQVTGLTFTQVLNNGTIPSLQVALTVAYKGMGDAASSASMTINSTVSTRFNE